MSLSPLARCGLAAMLAALALGTARRAGADPNANCKPNRATCTANHQCCSGACTAGVCVTPTTTTSTTTTTTTSTTTSSTTTSTTSTTTTVPTAQACPVECTPIICAAQGDLCEPCLGAGRGGSPGAGVCEPGVEGGLRCQAGGSCLEPNNCTSSAQCPAGQFCGPSNGGNACCPLCQPAPRLAIKCSSQGDFCGDVLDPYAPNASQEYWCRTGPGFYDQGFCEPTTEGDLRCHALGCLSTTCTSSGESGSGFFCGRDAGGSGVNLCCPLCQ